MKSESTSILDEETVKVTTDNVTTTADFQAEAERSNEGEKIEIQTENLPSVMRTIVEAHDKKDKVLMLFCLFGVLSSLFPTVKGIYAGERIFSNLFIYVVGRAGSGKGKMNKVRQLVKRIQGFVVSQDVELLDALLEDPEGFEDYTSAPLIIPGNSTSAGFIAQLSRNHGKGLIIESEGDTVGNMFRSEHGNYSSMARKSFHHETISHYRKTDDEPYLYISEPKVSMLISSTPKQINKIIPSAENGLLSRFAFVFVESQEEFQNVFDKNNNVINEAYKQGELKLAETLKKIHGIGEIEISLTQEQEKKFVHYFRLSKAQIINLINEDLDGSVNRMGVIIFRICKLLTVLDCADKNELSKNITCKDVHFNLAMNLAEILIFNADKVIKMIEGNKKEDLTLDKREFYKALPDEIFTTKEAKSIAKKFKISNRAVDRLLTTSIFEKVAFGKYKKVQEKESEEKN